MICGTTDTTPLVPLELTVASSNKARALPN